MYAHWSQSLSVSFPVGFLFAIAFTCGKSTRTDLRVSKYPYMILNCTVHFSYQ